jgi:hypothetical protein
MTSAQASPHIITFYSYKGGTGRLMALANPRLPAIGTCLSPTSCGVPLRSATLSNPEHLTSYQQGDRGRIMPRV